MLNLEGFSSQSAFFCQERTIERLKEQRDRDEREKQEEIDNYKKDIKDLKERVSILQGDLTEKEVGQQNESVVLELFVVYVCLMFEVKKTIPLQQWSFNKFIW